MKSVFFLLDGSKNDTNYSPTISIQQQLEIVVLTRRSCHHPAKASTRYDLIANSNLFIMMICGHGTQHTMINVKFLPQHCNIANIFLSYLESSLDPVSQPASSAPLESTR